MTGCIDFDKDKISRLDRCWDAVARQDANQITCLKQIRKVSSEFRIEEYIVRAAKLIDNRLEEEVLGQVE